MFIGNNSIGPRSFDGDMLLVRLWNRTLSAAEVSTLYSGGDVYGSSVPTIDKWGAETNLITNGDFASDASSWAAVRATVAHDAGTGNPAGSIKVTATSDYGYGHQSYTVVAAQTYRLNFDYKNTAGDVAQYQIFDVTNAANIKARTDLADNTGWASKSPVFFTAPTGCTSVRVIFISKLNTDVCWFDNIDVVRTGAVLEYALKHQNAFSPFKFEKPRFLPNTEPIGPNQFVGVAGGGQTVVDDLGDAELLFPHRVLRVSGGNDTDLRGFFQDAVVNYSENTFTWADEDAAEKTVRLWPVGSFPNPVQGAGGLFNVDISIREEIT